MADTEPKNLDTEFPRPAARALIVRDDALLAIRMRGYGREFYVLPGGGQRHGETLLDALRRECREELGCEIIAGALAYVREYIGSRHELPAEHAGFHALECVFHCSLPEGAQLRPHRPDVEQVGIVWLPLAQLAEFPLYPKYLREHWRDGTAATLPVYLGDIN